MAKIVLTAPTTRPYFADSVRLSHIGWHPEQKQVSIRFSIGYEDPDGTWHETGDKHELVENKPAVLDLAGAVVALADPQYDRLLALINTANLTAMPLDRLILTELGLSLFVGSVI